MDETTELFNQIICCIPELKDAQLTDEQRETAKNNLFALIDQWKQTPEYLEKYGLLVDKVEGAEPEYRVLDTVEGVEPIPHVVDHDIKYLVEKWGTFAEWAMKHTPKT